MNPDQLTSWLSNWSNIWSLPNLPQQVHRSPSPRLRTSLGRCQPQTGNIRLHAALLTADESLLKEVICHEVAHVAVYLLHGNTPRPHGPEWAALMRSAGFKPRTRMPPSLLSPDLRESVRPRFLYQHRCPICGASRLAGRPVRRWRCRACVETGLDGKLEISTQPRIDATK